MVLPINLGGIAQVGGKTVATGVSSQLDTKAIIDALVEVKRIPITRLEDRIDTNLKVNSALTTFKKKLTALQTSVDALRNAPGINTVATNVFSSRQAFLASNTSVEASTYLGVTAENGAQVASYTLTVDNLAVAKAQKTISFTSKTDSVTDAAATNNANKFSAGSIHITGGYIKTDVEAYSSDNLNTTMAVTSLTSDNIASAEITKTGTVGATILDNTFGTGGINNIAVTGTGDKNLIGTLSSSLTSLSSSQAGGVGTAVTLTATINGSTYTSNAITANTGGGSNEVAAATTITFTESTTGTSFDIRTNAAYIISDATTLAAFADDINTDLDTITFFQSRQLTNFDNARTAGTTLSGLTSSHVKLYSDEFGLLSGSHGNIGRFTVSAVSAPAAADATISVVIDGETYQATGLGTAGADTHTANITLSSLSTSKTLTLNINTAGVTLDFSDSTTAAAIEADLDTVFRTKGDYLVDGTISGSVYDNTYGDNGVYIVATNGDTSLHGDLAIAVSSVTAVQSAGTGGVVVLTMVINGDTYTSNDITANTGGGSDEIAAGTTITFTHSSNTTVFSMQINSAIAITNTTDLDAFAADTKTALAGVDVYLDREISNFNSSAVTASSVFDGLVSSNVKLLSNAYNLSDDSHGQMSNLTITAVTGIGNQDATMSIKIDGETYQATGLGTAASDTHTNNIILSSTTTNKEFVINIADAGITLDFSSATTINQMTEDLNLILQTGVNVEIDEGDSLIDIADAINSMSETSGMYATIVQVSDTDYKLMFQSKETETENAYIIIDNEDVFTSTVALSSVSSAEDASITFNGISLDRQTNVIDDVIDNVTFSLFQETPALTELTIDIEGNTTGMQNGIVNFLNAYNEYRIFIAEQKDRDADGAFTEDAILQNNSTFDSVINLINKEISKIVDGISSSAPNRLSDIGITMVDFEGDDETHAAKNVLDVDLTELESALAKNFDEVRRIFEFDFVASSSKLHVYSRTNDLSITDFTVDVDTSRSDGDKIRITYNNGTSDVTINADYTASGTGGTITGQDGTVLEGLKLLYIGDGEDVITVAVSQGIADRIYNITKDIIEISGDIDDEVLRNLDRNDDIQVDIDRMELVVDKFRQQKLLEFSALEEVIAQANSVLQLLDIQDKARNSSNN